MTGRGLEAGWGAQTGSLGEARAPWGKEDKCSPPIGRGPDPPLVSPEADSWMSRSLEACQRGAEEGSVGRGLS